MQTVYKTITVGERTDRTEEGRRAVYVRSAPSRAGRRGGVVVDLAEYRRGPAGAQQGRAGEKAGPRPRRPRTPWLFLDCAASAALILVAVAFVLKIL